MIIYYFSLESQKNQLHLNFVQSVLIVNYSTINFFIYIYILKYKNASAVCECIGGSKMGTSLGLDGGTLSVQFLLFSFFVGIYTMSK